MKILLVDDHVLFAESLRTISNHLQHIFEKLQVNSTVEAVTKGIQMGYITLDFKQ